LATCRTFMIVDRSTPAAVAAAATVVSPRTSCNQISYFTDGGKNFFARRVGPVILSLIRVSLQERPDPSSVD